MGDLEHVRRAPLPWRPDDTRTECGLPADRYPSITFEELVAKAKRLGQQRTAMTTCMTCFERARTYERLHTLLVPEPLEVLSRELDRVRYGGNAQKQADRDLLVRELTAMWALVEEHRAEFDEMVAGLAEAVDLGARRRTHGTR